MHIFKNRPLFCACMLSVAFSVVFFFTDLSPKIFAACLCILMLPFIIICRIRNKISLQRTVTLILCCIFICISAISSSVYFNAKYKKYSSLPKDNKYNIRAVVLSEKYSAGASSEYTVLVTSIDGDRCSFKANVECNYISTMQVGNEITGTFSSGEFEESIGAYKEKYIMLSEGILARFISDTEESLHITKQHSSHPLSILLLVNRHLSNKLKYHLGDHAGALASAILLGNRNEIPTSTVRDFRRAGASHILAISGLHMSILFGTLAFLMTKIRVPYKARAILLAILSVLYLAFTGFSVSATRSVIMLVAVYISRLCEYKADPLTSLSIAGTMILLLSPNAVSDSGFWMSFAATFGILVYIPVFQNFIFRISQSKYKRWKIFIVPLTAVSTAILTSVCAIAPLVIVLCIFTREISLFSVLSSLVLGIPTQIMLILTPLYLAFINVPVASKLLHIAINKCAFFMTDYCAYISSKENCMISFNYDYTVYVAVILGIILFICMMLKFRHKALSSMPFLSAILIFAAMISYSTHVNSKYIQISYVNQADNRNMILATNGDQTLLLDMTPGYYTSLNLAYAEMKNINVTEIDSYIMTGYTTAHISSLSKSFQSHIIRKLYIPKPENSEDYFRMVSVMECASDFGVTVDYYESGKNYTFIDGMSVNITRERVSRSTAPLLIIQIDAGEKLTYLSASYTEGDLSDTAYDAIEDTDHLIFGSRGPTPKHKYKIFNGENIKDIIFSSNEIASYYDTDSFVLPDTLMILSPDIYRYKFVKD